MNLFKYLKEIIESYRLVKERKISEIEIKIRGEVSQLKYNITKLEEEIKELHRLREVNSNTIKKCIDSVNDRLQTQINELNFKENKE